MHGFRDRPLTWLLVAATICVDLAMILPVLFPSSELDDYLPKLMISLGVPAQLSLVALWAATSEGFRLARGAVLTAAVYAATFAAMLFAFTRQEVASYFMLPALAIWGISLAMRLLGWLPGWSFGGTIEQADGSQGLGLPIADRESQEGEETPEKLHPWRFSIIELFGWTCIVALWAYALHHAILWPYSWSWLARTMIVPLLMVVLLGGPGAWWLRSGCVGLVIGLMLLIQRQYGVVIYWIPSAYLALWYVVRRLDRGTV